MSLILVLGLTIFSLTISYSVISFAIYPAICVLTSLLNLLAAYLFPASVVAPLHMTISPFSSLLIHRTDAGVT